jgi:VIT1/CCC1 family predicted Fe2+/Mn2+ transporter
VGTLALSDYLGKFWFSAEPMFGVIMVVCFTSIFRSFPDLSDPIVDRVIQAALACCLAWGLVDGIFYVWEGRFERRRKNRIIKILKGENKTEAATMIDSAMNDSYLDYMDEGDRAQAIQKISQNLSKEEPTKISWKDDLIVIGISILLVVGTALFVVMPFYIIEDLMDALLVSNILCIVVLFMLGFYREESESLLRKVVSGQFTALIGVIITVITVMLGG